MGLTMAKPCRFIGMITELSRSRRVRKANSMDHKKHGSAAFLGLPFDNVTVAEALDALERKIDERSFHQVASANVQLALHAIRDSAIQSILCSCDLIVPDGTTILLASRVTGGAKLKERVSTAELIAGLAELSARRAYGMYLLGASEEVSRRAAETLRARFPGLRIVGRHPLAPVPLDRMDHEEILGSIESCKPDILLVAMERPQQERWLAMHRNRLSVPLCMGVDASFDILAETSSPAPAWVRSARLEWLRRARRNPGRAAKRYMSSACGLFLHLPGQVAATVIQPRKPFLSRIVSRDEGHAVVFSIGGDFTASLRRKLDDRLLRAHEENRHIVLDMAEVAYLGADSLGSLLQLTAEMRRSGRQLWFANMPAHLLRVMRAAHVSDCFPVASDVRDAMYRIEKSEGELPAALASMGGFPQTSRRMDIRVEMLKDVCERIVALAASPELSPRLSLDRLPPQTPASR